MELGSEAAPVSWVLVFDFAKQDTLSCAFSCSESKSAMVFLCISEPNMSKTDYSEMEFRFQVRGCQILVWREIQWLVQQLFLQESLHKLWIVGLPRSVYSRHTGMASRRVRSCISYQPIPGTRTMRVCKPLWIELSRTVIRSPDCFFCKLFPDARHGENTKEFGSSEITHNCFFFHGFSFFSRILSCPFSSAIKPNCSHKFETAP